MGCKLILRAWGVSSSVAPCHNLPSDIGNFQHPSLHLPTKGCAQGGAGALSLLPPA